MGSAANIELPPDALGLSPDVSMLSHKKESPEAIEIGSSSFHSEKETTSSKEKVGNSMLLVFSVLARAQTILRENRAHTRQSTQHHERLWEATAAKISKTHQEAANRHRWASYTYFIAPALLLTGTIVGLHLKGLNPKTIEGAQQTLNDWPGRCPNILQRPVSFICGASIPLLQCENKDVKVGEIFNSGSSLASQLTQTNLENLKMENESKQAPLAMQSQACSSRHQSYGSDESSDKQQLPELDRLTREIAHQEAQIFQGSTGRG